LGEFKTFFLAFLYIDEEVTSCSSRNEGKGPPEPEGDRRRAPNPVFFLPSSKEAPEAQTHPELESFFI